MEEQKAKNWTAIVIAIAVTAVLAIFGTWYFTSGTKADKLIPDNFIIDVTELNIGDKIVNWTVEKIQPFTDTMEDTSSFNQKDLELGNDNVQLDLKASQEITGEYSYEYDAFTGKKYVLLFSVADPKEIAKIPYIYYFSRHYNENYDVIMGPNNSKLTLSENNTLLGKYDFKQPSLLVFRLDDFNSLDDIDNNDSNLEEKVEKHHTDNLNKYSKMLGFSADNQNHKGIITVKATNLRLTNYPSAIPNIMTISEVINVAK